MLNFKAEKSIYNLALIYKLLYSLLIVLLVFCVDALLKIKFSSDTYVNVIIVLGILNFGDFIQKERVSQISIDIEAKKMILHLKSNLSGDRTVGIPFQNTTLKIALNSNIFRSKPSIKIFNDNKFICQINEQNDGFSATNLLELSKTFAELNFPISKL